MSTPYPPSQPNEPQQPVEPQPTDSAPDAPTAYPAATPAPTAYPAATPAPTAYPQQAAYPQQTAYQQPGYGTAGAQQQPATQTNTMAIVSLIGAIVFWPIGIVCGIIALSQIKRTGQGGRGLALAGVIIGAIFGVITLAVIVILAIAANRVSDNVGDLGDLGNSITVQADVVAVASWAESVKTQSGAYPTELSADAPSTGDVDITLVPSGADLCVQGDLGNATYHMINYSEVLEGAC